MTKGKRRRTARPSTSRETILRNRPAIIARRHADVLSKTPRTMALIGETGRQGDFRERQVRACKKLLGPLHPFADQVIMRRDADGLLEGANEVADLEIGKPGQRFHADTLLDVRIDVIAQAPQYPGRQSAAGKAGSGNRVCLIDWKSDQPRRLGFRQSFRNCRVRSRRGRFNFAVVGQLEHDWTSCQSVAAPLPRFPSCGAGCSTRLYQPIVRACNHITRWYDKIARCSCARSVRVPIIPSCDDGGLFGVVWVSS